MKDVLEDSRLVGLQREGGAVLARLRKESDLRYPHCEDFRFALTKSPACVLILTCEKKNCSRSPNRFLSSTASPAMCSDAVDSVTSLYNQVEEQAHALVQRSNMSLEHLDHLLQLRELEGHFLQVRLISVTSAVDLREAGRTLRLYSKMKN